MSGARVSPASRGRLSLGRALAGALLLVWLIGLGAYPLLESTEGRYASIAAAMSRTGDYLEPRFNGLAHLDKPPLAYWADALSLNVLGRNEFAVRLPAAAALILSAWLVARIGVAAGLGRDRARRAAVLAGLAPLAFVQGHMLSTDIFLWVGVLAVFYGVAAEREGSVRRALWTGLGLSAGFLAKGHVVLLWVVPPVLAWAVVDRRRRAAAILLHPVSLLAFLATAAPWFALVLRRHPGLLDFWLRRETVDRYLTTVHGRGEPWWYFIALLPLCVLPWLPEGVRGVARSVKKAGVPRLWLLWAFVPLVLLCFSGSKRPNYILPLVAPLALLAAAETSKPLGRSARRRLGVWAAIALLSPFAMPIVPGAVPPTKRLIASLRAEEAARPGPGGRPGGAARSAAKQAERDAPSDAAAALRDSTAGDVASDRAGDARGGADLIAYKVLPSSLEYYWGKPVPTVGVRRFHSFDADSTVARLLLDEGQMAARLDKGALVLIEVKAAWKVEALLGGQLAPAARERDLLVAEKADAP